VNTLINYLTSVHTMDLFPQEERSEILRVMYVCILRAAKDGADTIRINATQIKWYKNEEELGVFGRAESLIPISQHAYRTTMRRILEIDHVMSQHLFVISETADELTLRFKQPQLSDTGLSGPPVDSST
jgi:hypothetical protein